MRSTQQQLGVLETISAFAFRHRETKKYLCRDGRKFKSWGFRQYRIKRPTRQHKFAPYFSSSIHFHFGNKNDVGASKIPSCISLRRFMSH